MTGCGRWGGSDPPLEVCSPAHPLVNGVFILSGWLLAVIAFVWHDWISPTALGRCGSFLLPAGGMLRAGTGMVPADSEPPIHPRLGSGGAVVENIGLLTVGIAMTAWSKTRRIGRVEFGGLTIGLGVLGLVGTALMAVPPEWGLPVGIIERLAVYPFLIWFVLAGWMQLR